VLEQFKKGDERSMEEILEDILEQNYLPSFCTACFRMGRTGKDFMDLAKPGEIHNFCRPNAILTFKEYLLDYAPEDIKELGEKVMNHYLEMIDNKKIKDETIKKLERLEEGERDLYF
jgi:2-iminoacetate synthase